jgi:hypothetical protein
MTALEHGLSAEPKSEGRFLQIGGMRVSYDSSLPPGKRVLSYKIISTNTETCESSPIELDRIYTLSTRQYLALGI